MILLFLLNYLNIFYNTIIFIILFKYIFNMFNNNLISWMVVIYLLYYLNICLIYLMIFKL